MVVSFQKFKMKQSISKKNFVINDVTYTLVLTTRSYIEYYEIIGSSRIRRKVYGGINRVDGNDKKLNFAIDFIEKQNLKKNIISVSLLMNALECDKGNLRTKTYKSYKVKIVHWLSWLKDNHYTEMNVNDDIITKYINHLRSKMLASKTIRNYFISIKCVYAKANLEPFSKKIKIAAASTSLSFFSNEQSEKIINHCKQHNQILYLAIKFLFHCFIRPGEMRYLKFEHIDFDSSTITIPASISKNKKTQTVAIPKSFYIELITYRNIDRNAYILGKYGIGSNMCVSTNFYNTNHKKILDYLEIKGNYALYSWKHTGVVRASKSGINLKDLQLQLRHHSLDMVNEYLKNLGVIDSDDLFNKMPTL